MRLYPVLGVLSKMRRNCVGFCPVLCFVIRWWCSKESAVLSNARNSLSCELQFNMLWCAVKSGVRCISRCVRIETCCVRKWKEMQLCAAVCSFCGRYSWYLIQCTCVLCCCGRDFWCDIIVQCWVHECGMWQCEHIKMWFIYLLLNCVV